MAVNGEINVVSLIDVMMLLMVIFMIAAPMMQGGVDVALPQASVRPLEAKNGLVVTVRANGEIFVDDLAMSYAEFAGSVKGLSDAKGGGGVYVKGDSSASLGSFVRVLGALTAAGITDVGIIAEPEPRR